MRHRAFRYVATILSLLLVAVVPAQAGSISFSDVTLVGNFQSGQGQDLRLRTVSQGGSTTASGTSATASQSGSSSTPSSLISTATSPQELQGNVETVEQGDITGTICDCGEITIPGGGFPWWPFLGGVPAVCLTGVCTSEKNKCVGACCTGDCSTPVPEPVSLLLLGSGLAVLGAGARRRFRRQAESVNQTATATEV